MAEKENKRTAIPRIYEQPDHATSFYSDLAQITATGHEVVVQFYESIPGAPDKEGKIPNVKTRLRATVTISKVHARNLGKLLLEKAGEGEAK